jgi:hypothetical protein
MTEEKEYLRFPGYVSVKEAAEILGLKENRVWYYIRLKRLPARRIDGRSMIPEQSLKEFHVKPRGRLRTDPPHWREYRGGAHVLGLQIELQVDPARRENLQDRLEHILKEQLHLFPGTMQRYVFGVRTDPRIILVMLIWKDTELISEDALESDLAEFKAEFGDLFNWDTARYLPVDAMLHT